MKYLDLIELQQKWRKCGDPHFVWEAYSLAREAGCPVPEWVMREMDNCAAAILRPPAKTKRLGKQVRDALRTMPAPQHSGPGHYYARLGIQRRRIDAFGKVATRLADKRRPLNDVVIEVSIENATGKAALNRDYKALLTGFPDFK